MPYSIFWTTPEETGPSPETSASATASSSCDRTSDPLCLKVGYTWRCPKIGVPNSWMVSFSENPKIKWMITGVSLFQETSTLVPWYTSKLLIGKVIGQQIQGYPVRRTWMKIPKPWATMATVTSSASLESLPKSLKSCYVSYSY